MIRKSILLGLCFLSTSLVMADDLEKLIEAEQTKPVEAQETIAESNLTKLIGKKLTAQQNVFFRSFESKDWRKTLLNWGPAFNGTQFERSENGKALKAYLFYKNGLNITGVEKLFEISNPKNINSEIKFLWKSAVSDTSSVWTIADLKWNPGFTEIFGPAAEVQSKLKNIDLKTDQNLLKDMSNKTAQSTKARAMIDWPLALSYALNDKPADAAKIIGQLLKNSKSPYSEDLVNLTAGRLLFQNGYFEAASKYYEKVTKKSDYWLEAQEELAWTYLRQGQTQNALATSRSLMSPAFDNRLGPEPYFVETLGQLKVCNYPKVVEGLEQFPKRFKNRTLELNKLAQNEKAKFLDEEITKLRDQGVSWKTVGDNAKVLPRELVKDYKVIRLIEGQKLLEQEAQAAATLYADSLALTGFQGQFETIKNNVNQRANKIKSATAERIKFLAKNEVVEIKNILEKLHIVEAELIQSVELTDRVAKNSSGLDLGVKKGTTGSKDPKALVFQADKEIWFDELSHYRVDVKNGCQTVKK